MTTAFFAPPGERTCLHWDGVTSTYCHGTDNVRPYQQGNRCPLHTPSALAGRPEPDALLCPFCGGPVASLLSGCNQPDCRTTELDEDRAYQRAMDI